MNNPLSKILRVCKRIQNGRDKNVVRNALDCEYTELQDEIIKDAFGQEAGPDGVTGECIDVILVAMDLIYQYNPNITDEEIIALVDKKLYKWETLYGTPELAAATMASK